MVNLWNLFFGSAQNEDELVKEVKNKEEITLGKTVMIIGVMEDEINCELADRYPQQFECTVTDTTRTPLENEVDGADYRFVSLKCYVQNVYDHRYVEMKIIKENLYGTTYANVKNVIKQGRHCLFQPCCEGTIGLLQEIKIDPIIILIKASNIEKIMDWDDDSMTVEDALRELENCQRVEETFAKMINHVILDANSWEDIIQEVLEIVDRSTGKERKISERSGESSQSTSVEAIHLV